MGVHAASTGGRKLGVVGREPWPSRHRPLAIALISVRALLALALLGLAASLVMLTVELSRWRAQVPDVLAQSRGWQRQVSSVDKQVELLQPKLDDALRLSHQVLTETERVRREVPPILHEVARVNETVREALPRWDATLKRVDGIEAQLPRTLKTFQAAVEQVKRVNDELPGVLEEVRASRHDAHTLLDQAEHVVEQSKEAGKEASEGAVKGFITGVLKLPFAPILRLRDRHREEDQNVTDYQKHLTKRDRHLIRSATYAALAAGKAGTSFPWKNPKSHNGGTVTLKRVHGGSDPCRDVAYRLDLADGKHARHTLSVCRKDGQWRVVDHRPD